jgi:DNA processing protein
MMELDLGSPADSKLGISPQREMGAYEALWDEDGATFKTIFEKLNKRPDTIPSDLVEPTRVEKYRRVVRDVMAKANVERFGVRVLGAGEYCHKECNCN